MESFSIQSYSAQMRIYSSSAGPPATGGPPAGPPVSGALASGALASGPPNTALVALPNDGASRNTDGDSFSLSLEARIVQISMTQSDDGITLKNQDDTNQSGSSFGSSLIKALMQTMSSLLGKDDAGSLTLGTTSSSVSVVEMEETHSVGRKSYSQSHVGHHKHDWNQSNPMGNPEDVASKVLQQLQNEHSQKGGSLQVFIDNIQKRMDNRKTAASNVLDQSSEFRLQVNTLITSGLTSWSQRGGQSLNIQA